MTDATKATLDALRSEAPQLFAQPGTEEEISLAEQQVGIPFSDDYREFLRLYGAGTVGPFPIFGTGSAEWGSCDSTVVEITESFREAGWPNADSWAVISHDYAGNPIGLAADGSVWRYDHDAIVTERLAGSFERFIHYLLR